MRADVLSASRNGDARFHMAVKNGAVDALTMLLKTGAGTNAPDPSAEGTKLDCAIEKVEMFGPPYLTAVRAMIEHGASFSRWETQKLENMCAKAIVNDIEGLVEIYLDNGCCPNARSSEHGLPLLAVAATWGRVEIGKLLMKRGARADAEPSALSSAVINNQPHFVHFILREAQNSWMLELDKRRCLRIAALEAEMDSESRKAMIGVFLRNGVNIDTEVDSSFNTVLHGAVLADRPRLIQTLLDLCADPNVQNGEGSTPLMLAAQTENTEAARLLIRKGKALCGCERHDGWHALHVAIAADCVTMVQCLLEEGAPVNLAGGDGVTPLQLAVIKSNPVIVKMLQDAGADLSVTRNSLIQEAIEHEATDVLEVLLGHGRETSQAGADGARWLLFACQLNKPAVVGFLLEAGADPNGDPDYRESPLQAAIVGRARRSLEFLLETGADPNVKTEDGVPLTILALRQGNFFAVRALVNSGSVDLTSTTTDGSHLLHEAVCSRYEPLVSFLLGKGAPVNQVGANGQTPLKEAVMMSYRAIARLLLKAGADVSLDGGALLASAIEKGDLEVLRLLHDAGIDLDQEDDDGNLPLAAACKGNKKDIVQFLLDAGAAVNKTPRGAKTPLMTAVLAKADCSFIKRLLDNGAYPNTFDDEGNTTLHIAVRNGNIELVRLLLEHGADQFICNARRLTARQIACCLNFNDIVKLLDLHMIQQNSERRSQLSTGDDTDGQITSAEQFLVAVEDMFVCPITLEIMEDPVLAADGHCYERSAITSWLQSNGDSPMTRRQMSTKALIPNVIVKQQIDLFLKTRSR